MGCGAALACDHLYHQQGHIRECEAARSGVGGTARPRTRDLADSAVLRIRTPIKQ